MCETKFGIRTVNYILLDEPILICGCSDGQILVWMWSESDCLGLEYQ